MSRFSHVSRSSAVPSAAGETAFAPARALLGREGLRRSFASGSIRGYGVPVDEMEPNAPLASTPSSRPLTVLPPMVGNRGASGAVQPARLGVETSERGVLQAKLAVGGPEDPLEVEADRVAEHVMRMPADRGGRDVPRVSSIGSARSAGIAPSVQRVCSNCEEEAVQRKAAGGAQGQNGVGGAVGRSPSASVEAGVHAMRRGGDRLPDSARRFFEPRFGRALGDVRVHADAEAGRVAESLNARAFTVDNNIVFARGQYSPESDATRRLLAHELTHVVQQRGDGPTDGARSAVATVQRQLGPGAPPQEEEPAPAPAAGPAPQPGPTLMMAKPPHFPQSALTCWASAIASWQRVKGLVGPNVTDRTLLEHYRRTSCVDEDLALLGVANIEAVFAEWRLLLSLGATMPEPKLTFAFFKSLIEQHGHFVIATGEITGGSGMLHAQVVYGVRSNDKNNPTDFTLFVEDPLAEDNERHIMFLARPVRIALGTEASAGPARCRSIKR